MKIIEPLRLKSAFSLPLNISLEELRNRVDRYPMNTEGDGLVDYALAGFLIRETDDATFIVRKDPTARGTAVHGELKLEIGAGVSIADVRVKSSSISTAFLWVFMGLGLTGIIIHGVKGNWHSVLFLLPWVIVPYVADFLWFKWTVHKLKKWLESGLLKP